MSTLAAGSINVHANPTVRVRDLPGMKSSITFSDEFTPISKPPMVPHDNKSTLDNHSNVYHPSQLHTGHHRKPSPSPDHSSLKEVVVHNDKEPLTVFTHARRPSASPDPNALRNIVTGSPASVERVPLHRKPCPSPNRPTSAVVNHEDTTAAPTVTHKKPVASMVDHSSMKSVVTQADTVVAPVVHKKPSSVVDHSSMKSVVTQAPVDNSNRRVRPPPGGTDHIVFG